MKILKHTLFAAAVGFAFIGCSTNDGLQSTSEDSISASTSSELSKAEVLALFDQWNASLATGDPQKVAANYAPDAVLIPTVSGKVRKTQDTRVDYFTYFLKGKPRGKIDRATVRVFETIAINSGLYTFTFADGHKVSARYTFVYEKQPDGKWLIIEHHSSKLPGGG